MFSDFLKIFCFCIIISIRGVAQCHYLYLKNAKLQTETWAQDRRESATKDLNMTVILCLSVLSNQIIDFNCKNRDKHEKKFLILREISQWMHFTEIGSAE